MVCCSYGELAYFRVCLPMIFIVFALMCFFCDFYSSIKNIFCVSEKFITNNDPVSCTAVKCYSIREVCFFRKSGAIHHSMKMFHQMYNFCDIDWDFYVFFYKSSSWISCFLFSFSAILLDFFFCKFSINSKVFLFNSKISLA